MPPVNTTLHSATSGLSTSTLGMSPGVRFIIGVAVLFSLGMVFHCIRGMIRHRSSKAVNKKDIEAQLPASRSEILARYPSVESDLDKLAFCFPKSVDLSCSTSLSSTSTTSIQSADISSGYPCSKVHQSDNEGDLEDGPFFSTSMITASPADWDLYLAGSDGSSGFDLLSTPSLSSEDEDNVSEESVDITDVFHSYILSPSTSIVPKSFFDANAITVPMIRIQTCEDPTPFDDDLKDTTLAAALSVTNLAMDYLLVPKRSFRAPRPKPTTVLRAGGSGAWFGRSLSAPRWNFRTLVRFVRGSRA